MADGNDFAGPSVGSFENDQFQGHKHQIKALDNGSSGATDWLLRGNAVGSSGSSFMENNPVTDGTNGNPRYGDETRPFNAGVKYCIKF